MASVRAPGLNMVLDTDVLSSGSPLPALAEARMSIRSPRLALFLLTSFSVATSAQQPERIDSAMNAKIRAEGTDRSKILWIEHFLTDVYGPRPTGSPNHVAAANGAIKARTSGGMRNAHLEPFTWRGIGWLPGRATGFITSPVKANLKFEALPWSPRSEEHT